MSSCTETPSLSLAGTLDYCTSTGSCPLPVSLTLQDVTTFCPTQKSVTGGSSEVFTAPVTSNFMMITVPRPVQIIMDGGAEFIPVERMHLHTGAVTSVEVFNDVDTPLKDMDVKVVFANGTYL